MELKKFSEELKRRMNAEIETIIAEQPDLLARTSQLIVVVEKSIYELKLIVIKYKFKSIDEEIEFFKVIKPEFVGLLGYYRKLFEIQLFEAHNPTEERLKYCRNQLKRLESYMERNRDYYHYILSKSDHMDEKYFARGHGLPNTAVIDDRFSTSGEIRLSKLLCNERVREYLTGTIQKTEKPTSVSTSSALKWTGSKTDLIELIYALQAAGVFNRSSADIKEIASYFESMFAVSLGNWYRVYQEIRQRKSSQVKFIEQLRNFLLKKIEEKDS
jgi:hypothetical protein